MRSSDSPENWQKRGAAPIEPPAKVSLAGRIFSALFLLAALAGGLGAYVVIGRESSLSGTLPLPKKLRTVSEAHEDLLLFGRELNEIAIEAEGRLQHPSPSNRPVARRLADRLGRLHKTGRSLEPRLTREESRALTAWQNGERLLAAYLASSTNVAGAFDPQLLLSARAQLTLAEDLAHGKDLDNLVASRVKRLGGTTPASVTSDVKTAGEHLRLTGDE